MKTMTHDPQEFDNGMSDSTAVSPRKLAVQVIQLCSSWLGQWTCAFILPPQLCLLLLERTGVSDGSATWAFWPPSLC